MASFTDLSVQLLLLATLFPTLALSYINSATTSIHQNATKSSAYRARLVTTLECWRRRTSSVARVFLVEVVGSGIYAAHASFNDHGVPPPPARWKGSCDAGQCNNKLIGAKSLIAGDDSDDEDGHGTHTSSTAAGNFVTGASYTGVGTGTPAGIAPSAHIAMYKVCVARDCKSSAILAGLEEAIKDGVDVLSLSLGSSTSANFDQDPISIGAFSAVSKGILVVCATGNSGPFQRSVTNEAPWLLTVAASSVDRSFGANIHLGNGKSIDGEALTQIANPSSKLHSLLYSEE
uniref:Xylem serine proteinase 1 n=1 Tax=Aegilops tauschii TaxID=37682 RepID=M8BCT2_AEGTA